MMFFNFLSSKRNGIFFRSHTVRLILSVFLHQLLHKFFLKGMLKFILKQLQHGLV